ncbi:MAG TPA: glycosyl transferase family 1 [Rikenellaceae bacterium]|nr:glycosyl transferase family 1 [Rikenellaceae bacterium]
MRIALLGTRGTPARYSGFETFYEQLATRLVKRGHQVTVYNRSHFIKDVKREYRGVNIVSLPSIPSKHLDTISHTFISSIHVLFHRSDVVYYCIVGNSPLVWIPRLLGAKVLLNVDGEDWAREKWSGFAKWYQKKCEWLATRTANVIVSDARGIQERYKCLYNADTVFVPYGANIIRDEGLASLKKWRLQPEQYILYVGRFVPENAIDLLINAFKACKTDKKLVIVGDAPYAADYKRHLYEIANEKVVFTGYAFETDYAQLSSHAYLYVQPSGIDGTRPALLDQMGFGNCVLVRNSKVNMEVIGNCGCFFEKDRPFESLVEKLQYLINSPDVVQIFRDKVRTRIQNYYNWEWITDFYEDLFKKIYLNENLVSYDDFLYLNNYQP